MAEHLVYFSQLFDLYGVLLTEKQQECFKLHLFEDFSFSEIGETLGISRQAAFDNIQRAEKSLENFEKKLGFSHRLEEQREKLTEIYEMLEPMRDKNPPAELIEVLHRLRPYVRRNEFDL